MTYQSHKYYLGPPKSDLKKLPYYIVNNHGAYFEVKSLFGCGLRPIDIPDFLLEHDLNDYPAPVQQLVLPTGASVKLWALSGERHIRDFVGISPSESYCPILIYSTGLHMEIHQTTVSPNNLIDDPISFMEEYEV